MTAIRPHTASPRLRNVRKSGCGTEPLVPKSNLIDGSEGCSESSGGGAGGGGSGGGQPTLVLRPVVVTAPRYRPPRTFSIPRIPFIPRFPVFPPRTPSYPSLNNRGFEFPRRAEGGGGGSTGGTTSAVAHSEGADMEYDAAYWENPNLTFQQQNLPTFQNFNNAYPKTNGGLMAASDVYALIGGNVLALANLHNYTNACAARVSRALNYSGVTIPNIPGQTFRGADNKYYFLSAANLRAWMRNTFGAPSISLNQLQTGTNGSGFIRSANGRGGVYFMTPRYSGPSGFGASGHADIFNGTSFNGSGYFTPRRGLEKVELWILN